MNSVMRMGPGEIAGLVRLSQGVRMGPVGTKSTSEPSPHIATGIVVTDLSLRPIALDNGAASILSDIGNSNETKNAPWVPKQIHDAVSGRGGDDISGVRVAIQGANARYRCVIYTVRSHSAILAEPMLILHFQRSLSAEDAIDHIAHACHLRGREIAVLRGLSNGLTSKEIAFDMKISPNTVKSYIRLIMVKIGVTTRSGIVGKLLEFIAL